MSTARQDAPPREWRLNLRVLPLVGMVGSSMGLLGIGGGLLAGPLLSGWLGQRQTTAQGLSLALVAPSSVVAVVPWPRMRRRTAFAMMLAATALWLIIGPRLVG